MLSVISEHIKAIYRYCNQLTVMFDHITADSCDSLYKQPLIMPKHNNIPDFNRANNSDSEKHAARFQGWFHRGGWDIPYEEHPPEQSDYRKATESGISNWANILVFFIYASENKKTER